MFENENEKPPERTFLTARNKVKTGKSLLMAVASDSEMLTGAEKERYCKLQCRDTPILYEKVVRRGDLFNCDPENTANPVQFNQQVNEEELADLRKKCSLKQFVEVVRFLPEYDFSLADTWRHVKGKSKISPCFECGVAGCLRRQERWQARVLHGCYPQVPISQFQHDKSDTCASCFFVNKRERTLASDKYLDVLSDFEEIDHHRTGKERKRIFRKKRFARSPKERREQR